VFLEFIVDRQLEPSLYNFVEDIKKNGAVFGNYSEEKLKEFEERLYELRKDNFNNSTGQIV
jgi:hypothetical protein